MTKPPEAGAFKCCKNCGSAEMVSAATTNCPGCGKPYAPEAGAEPLSAEMFWHKDDVDSPSYTGDFAHYANIFTFAEAYAAHVSQAYERRVRDLEREALVRNAQVEGYQSQWDERERQLAEAKDYGAHWNVKWNQGQDELAEVSQAYERRLRELKAEIKLSVQQVKELKRERDEALEDAHNERADCLTAERQLAEARERVKVAKELAERVATLIEGLPTYSKSASMYQRVEHVKRLLTELGEAESTPKALEDKV